LETIGGDLDDLPDIAWIVTSWSISSAVSFSLAGEFSDIWGRKVVILGGQVFTLVGAVSNFTSLFALRRQDSDRCYSHRSLPRSPIRFRQ
jgi:MFS family permease